MLTAGFSSGIWYPSYYVVYWTWQHAAEANRTVVMVAHRLTTLRGADRVMVLPVYPPCLLPTYRFCASV